MQGRAILQNPNVTVDLAAKQSWADVSDGDVSESLEDDGADLSHEEQVEDLNQPHAATPPRSDSKNDPIELCSTMHGSGSGRVTRTAVGTAEVLFTEMEIVDDLLAKYDQSKKDAPFSQVQRSRGRSSKTQVAEPDLGNGEFVLKHIPSGGILKFSVKNVISEREEMDIRLDADVLNMLYLYEQSLFVGASPIKLIVHNVDVTDSSTIDYPINGYSSAIIARDENIGESNSGHKLKSKKTLVSRPGKSIVSSRGDILLASDLEVYYVSGDDKVLFDEEWDQGKGEDDKESDLLNPKSNNTDGEEGNQKEGSGEPKDDIDNFSYLSSDDRFQMHT
ncbi:hypothetical protein NE237_015520 [Protea cynaroides]|uniref:Uncharacterized protein n=1 Tax=Protea cynaroides TaxID=273540 RepID=A0A9Q0QRA7_9MAGN|nr:hypothetical protein NE237_015520 [Protea cynaroides]